MQIGTYIKHLRTERGWSQPQLVREIHASHGSERPPAVAFTPNVANQRGGPRLGSMPALEPATVASHLSQNNTSRKVTHRIDYI